MSLGSFQDRAFFCRLRSEMSRLFYAGRAAGCSQKTSAEIADVELVLRKLLVCCETPADGLLIDSFNGKPQASLSNFASACGSPLNENG
jgi:hypothetical protein